MHTKQCSSGSFGPHEANSCELERFDAARKQVIFFESDHDTQLVDKFSLREFYAKKSWR